jgi:hypothetical protein
MYGHDALAKLEELTDLRNQICYDMIEAEGEELEDLEMKLEEIESEITELAYQEGLEDFKIDEFDDRKEA